MEQPKVATKELTKEATKEVAQEHVIKVNINLTMIVKIVWIIA